MTKKEIEKFFAGRFKTYRATKTILRIQKNNLNSARIAFIVSSAVKKNAVARNKTRRRMSEITRKIDLNPGADLIFSVKLTDKRPYLFKFLKEEIEKLLKLCGAL